jgi:hypothetical protein
VLFSLRPIHDSAAPEDKVQWNIEGERYLMSGHMDGKAMKLAKNLRHLLVSSSIPKKSKTTSNIMKIGPETGTRGSQITALT